MLSDAELSWGCLLSVLLESDDCLGTDVWERLEEEEEEEDEEEEEKEEEEEEAEGSKGAEGPGKGGGGGGLRVMSSLPPK
jgi:hypothetical protein